MQDIRQELRERIKQTQDRREQLHHELEQLDTTEQSLQGVLNSENELWKRLTPTSSLFQHVPVADEQSNNGGNTLPGLLTEFMRNGKAWSMDDFKAELQKRGYPFGEKAPGRVINFALVGLLNRKLVLHCEDGRWRLE
ncbi:MAG: hypothetical protein ACLQMO_06380 [Acidobacteriaceae bacterium]